MGIRVHKVLGYGLTDVRGDDDRVNWASGLLHGGELSAESFYRWLNARFTEKRQAGNFMFSLDMAMLNHSAKLRRADMERTVTFRGDYDDGVLLITPLGVDRWFRYDDPVDFVEETYFREDPQENRVEVIPGGIFPFNGVYMDARTGERLPLEIVTWVRACNVLAASPNPDGTVPETLDMLTRDCTPFETYEEAVQRVVPDVPAEIRDIAEFGELFTGPLVWTRLRPILYTYWA